MIATQSLLELNPDPKLACPTDDVGLGGMRSIDGRVFPLQSVKVRSTIAGPCARTVIEQRFSNPFDEVLDATWIFPLPGDGALIALELRAGDVVVVGECQKREEALAKFEEARTQGHRAALVETEQKGVHTLSLAGLPPKSDVTVQLTVVELLPIIDARFQFRFPTTIAPRYTPGTPVDHAGFGTEPDTDLVPNASRLTPPIRLAGGTLFDVEVEIAGALTSLESSLHAVKMQMDSGSARVAPSARATLNRDFILAFSVAESATPVTRAFTDGVYTALVIEPPTSLDVRALPRDAVFAVDISGSMEGPKLTAAKSALTSALHGLNTGDRFKLIAFDDRVEFFQSDFAEYNDNNLRRADAWIAALQSRGGTEMLQPIQECLSGETPVGRLRTVLFVTDGQSSDEARLLPAVANRRGNAVFFTLGIDSAVNEGLLKTLARAGGGVCELCTPTDDIDAVVAKLETRFGTPLLSDIHVDGAARPSGQTVFSGRPATVLIQGASEQISVTAVSPSGEYNHTVVPERVGFALGPIWARERVSWLEERLMMRPFEEEAIKPEILRIALEHQIASKFTSFVCVDKSVRTIGERRHVVQPAEMPAHWELHEMSAPAQAFGGARGAGMTFASPMRSRTVLPMPAPMPAPGSAPLSRPQVPPQAPVSDTPDYSTPEFFAEAESDAGGFSLRESVSKLFSAFGDSSPADTPKRSKTDSKKVSKHGQRDDSAESAATVPLSVKRSDIPGLLARLQNADGSFGGDVGRSAAALIALLLSGSTRLEGNRRRVVVKLVSWLEKHRDDSRAAMALSALQTFEAPGDHVPNAQWNMLASEGAEGDMLAVLLRTAS